MGDTARTELRTAVEALREAKLDWEVQSEPIYVSNEDGSGYKSVPNRQAIVRQDNRSVLGVVTKRYVPVQNVEAFTFADSLIGPNQAAYEQAGQTRGGERVWLQLRLPGDIQIEANPEDRIQKYIQLVNGHDGKRSVRAIVTPVRIACANQLTGTLRDTEHSISIRHTGVISQKVAEAQRLLGLTVKYYDELSHVYNALARKNVTQIEVRDFLRKLVPDTKDDKATTRTQNIRHEIEHLFQSGKGNDLSSIRGTAWALLNGVAEYTTHRRSARGTTESEKRSNRLDSTWFGTGAALNDRAFGLVRELAEVK